MKHKFTLEYLKTVAIPNGKSQLNISDPKETYLVARLGRRKPSWYCVKRVRGARKGAKSIYIGNLTLIGLEEARRESRRLASICDEGKDPTSITNTSDLDTITLDQAYEIYQKYRMEGLKGNSRKDIENRWAHLQPLTGKRLFKVTGSDLAELINRSEYKYVSVRATQLLDRMWRLIENQIPKKARFNLPVSPFEVMRTEIIGKYQYNKYLEAQKQRSLKRLIWVVTLPTLSISS